MKNDRSTQVTAQPPRPAAATRAPAEPAAYYTGGVLQAWTRFWFSPVDPRGLHVLRVIAGLTFFFWLLSFAGHQEALFGLGGWFDRQAYVEASRMEGGAPPTIGWSLAYLCGTDANLLNLLYWGSLGVLALFTLGVAPRITAFLTWLVVVSFTANPAMSYDADSLLVIVAFYLMIGYVLLGQWSRPLSLLARVLGTADASVFSWLSLKGRDAESRPGSYAANFLLRLLQVHFVMVVVTSALHKLQLGAWWAGVAFWYPLHDPFTTTAESLRSQAESATSILFGLSLAQYVVLGWQLGIPFFAWRKGWWRFILIGGALIGWAGSFFLFGQPLFGPVYLIGCLSFLTPSEWASLGGRFRAALSNLMPKMQAPPAKKVKVGNKT